MSTPDDPTIVQDPPTSPRGVGMPVPAPRNGLGTAALVLGIVGLVLSPGVVLGVVLGVLAVILGLVAHRRVRHGEATNGRATTAGIVLGALAIVVAVVVGVLVGPRVVAAVRDAAGASSLQQCVRDAHGDKAAARQCRQQFGGHGKHQARPAG